MYLLLSFYFIELTPDKLEYRFTLNMYLLVKETFENHFDRYSVL
jgi:hypothetical protein